MTIIFHSQTLINNSLYILTISNITTHYCCANYTRYCPYSKFSFVLEFTVLSITCGHERRGLSRPQTSYFSLKQKVKKNWDSDIFYWRTILILLVADS